MRPPPYLTSTLVGVPDARTPHHMRTLSPSPTVTRHPRYPLALYSSRSRAFFGSACAPAGMGCAQCGHKADAQMPAARHRPPPPVTYLSRERASVARTAAGSCRRSDLSTGHCRVPFKNQGGLRCDPRAHPAIRPGSCGSNGTRKTHGPHAVTHQRRTHTRPRWARRPACMGGRLGAGTCVKGAARTAPATRAVCTRSAWASRWRSSRRWG